MRRSIKLLVMGLPRAGKTTYLAAFWHLLTSNEIQNSLLLAEMQPSRDHLNTIATLWRQWREIPRTTLPKERVVTINVCLPGSTQVFELTVPDASGEAFKRIFETRRCSAAFEALAAEAQSVLLFIHPKQAIPPERIDVSVDRMSDVIERLQEVVSAARGIEPGQISVEKKLISASEAAGSGEKPANEGQGAKTLEWNPRFAAHQAKLVDLLQIAARFRGDKRTHLAIVISAWDRCIGEELKPEVWLRKSLPLLYQYVKANADICPFEVFGVSAQGAELDSPGSLVDTIRASDRITVVQGDATSRDLTLPVKYLLSSSEGPSDS